MADAYINSTPMTAQGSISGTVFVEFESVLQKWQFSPQPDKFGYVNTPEWDENVAKANDVHAPCGYWWKIPKEMPEDWFWVPHCCFAMAAPVIAHTPSNIPYLRVYFPMWMDVTPNGTLGLVYDENGRVWCGNLGMIRNQPRRSFWSTIEWDCSTSGYSILASSAANEDLVLWANFAYHHSWTGASYITVRYSLLVGNSVSHGIIPFYTEGVEGDFESNTHRLSCIADPVTEDLRIFSDAWYSNDDSMLKGGAVILLKSTDLGNTWTSSKIVFKAQTWIYTVWTERTSSGIYYLYVFLEDWSDTVTYLYLRGVRVYRSTDGDTYTLDWEHMPDSSVEALNDSEYCTPMCVFGDDVFVAYTTDAGYSVLDRFRTYVYRRDADTGTWSLYHSESTNFLAYYIFYDEYYEWNPDTETDELHTALYLVGERYSTVRSYLAADELRRSLDGATSECVQAFSVIDDATNSKIYSYDLCLFNGVIRKAGDWLICSAQEMHRFAGRTNPTYWPTRLELGFFKSGDNGKNWVWVSSPVSYAYLKTYVPRYEHYGNGGLVTYQNICAEPTCITPHREGGWAVFSAMRRDPTEPYAHFYLWDGSKMTHFKRFYFLADNDSYPYGVSFVYGGTKLRPKFMCVFMVYCPTLFPSLPNIAQIARFDGEKLYCDLLFQGNYMSTTGAWRIVSTPSDRVYMLYTKRDGSVYWTYYKYTDDWGATWSAEIRIESGNTWTSSYSFVVEQDGEDVYVQIPEGNKIYKITSGVASSFCTGSWTPSQGDLGGNSTEVYTSGTLGVQDNILTFFNIDMYNIPYTAKLWYSDDYGTTWTSLFNSFGYTTYSGRIFRGLHYDGHFTLVMRGGDDFNKYTDLKVYTATLGDASWTEIFSMHAPDRYVVKCYQEGSRMAITIFTREDDLDLDGGYTTWLLTSSDGGVTWDKRYFLQDKPQRYVPGITQVNRESSDPIIPKQEWNLGYEGPGQITKSLEGNYTKGSVWPKERKLDYGYNTVEQFRVSDLEKRNRF